MAKPVIEFELKFTEESERLIASMKETLRQVESLCDGSKDFKRTGVELIAIERQR